MKITSIETYWIQTGTFYCPKMVQASIDSDLNLKLFFGKEFEPNHSERKSLASKKPANSFESWSENNPSNSKSR